MTLRKKITEYFDAGVDRVWVVEPGQRKVLVFRAPTALTELGEGDTLRRRCACRLRLLRGWSPFSIRPALRPITLA
jgi:Uma2 family endonuclease